MLTKVYATLVTRRWPPMKDRRVDVAVASITETALIAMLLKGRNILGELASFLNQWKKGGNIQCKISNLSIWGIIQKKTNSGYIMEMM